MNMGVYPSIKESQEMRTDPEILKELDLPCVFAGWYFVELATNLLLSWLDLEGQRSPFPQEAPVLH